MAQIKTVKDYLANASFFNEMDDRQLDLLSGCAKIMNFDAGDFLLREGEEANSFYLILKGEVTVESYMPASGPMIITKCNADSITGFSWLFPPYLNQFDSRAQTRVKAIHINGKCIREKAEYDHSLGYQLMKQFAQIMLQRMQDSRRRILDVYCMEQ